MRNILLHKANKYTFTATCEKLEGTHIHNVGIGRSNFPDWKVDIHIISFPTVLCVCLQNRVFFCPRAVNPLESFRAGRLSTYGYILAQGLKLISMPHNLIFQLLQQRLALWWERPDWWWGVLPTSYAARTDLGPRRKLPGIWANDALMEPRRRYSVNAHTENPLSSNIPKNRL